MTVLLVVVAALLVLLAVATAPFAGFGTMFVLLGIALVVGLAALALGLGVSAGRLPRAPRDQFLRPDGPDDPDRPRA